MRTIQNAIDGRKGASASRRIASVYNPAMGEHKHCNRQPAM